MLKPFDVGGCSIKHAAHYSRFSPLKPQDRPKNWTLVHLPKRLGNNYKVARSGRLLCIGVMLYGPALRRRISHFIMSGKAVFHTTCTCRERRANESQWGLPLVSHWQ
ncbi:hypothetical protein XENOCAPTIV_025394 [Xenoophorus captivus]|uniref:Uncharacterized protein n=1 Tax=Xenoophorus captivus TaxID=1517983 RepID=A0ABV0RB55_9TELE